MRLVPPAVTRVAFRALNRVVVPLARSGLVSPLPVGSGLVLVETTGRVSGRRREVPLLATRVGDRVIVSTVRRDSQWVRNLESDPSGAVWLRGRRRPTRASVRSGFLQVVHLDLGAGESTVTAAPAAA